MEKSFSCTYCQLPEQTLLRIDRIVLKESRIVENFWLPAPKE